MGGLAVGKSIAMKAGVGGRGQFHLDLRVGKDDAIIAGPGGFVVVRKSLGIAGLFPVGVVLFRLDRLKGETPIFPSGSLPLMGVTRMSPKSAQPVPQVRVAEAENRVVRIMIAGAAVPGLQPGVGTELHHAEGDGGAGINVPVLPRCRSRV